MNTPLILETNTLFSKPKWCLWFGFLLLVIMAFSRMITEDVGEKSGLVMAVLGGGLLAIYGQELRRSIVLKFFLIALMIQLVSWGASQVFHPEWAERSPKLDRLVPWLYMIPIAVFLGGSTRNTLVVWAFAVFGVLASPWIMGGGWSEVERGLGGARVDFNVKNAQHIAMLFGTCAIGLLALTPRFYPTKFMRDFWKPLIWMVLVSACFIGVMVTQTRAVFLGIFLGLLILLIACFIWGAQSNLISLKSKISLICLFMIITLMLISKTSLKDLVEKRFEFEKSSISMILDGRTDFSANNSVGIRVNTWLEAVGWIKERPLLGWGGKGRNLVIKNTEGLSERSKEIYRHLHNSYMDVSVNYGLLGLMLMLTLFGFILYAAHFSWKQEVLPTDLLVFVYSFMGFWLVINCFESYMFYSSGIFVFGLVGGGVLTHYWKALRVSSEPISDK